VKENSGVVDFSNEKTIKVALVGNPNSGKSTLFNALTGLNQRTGNFPGVTVDKKSGFLKLNNHQTAEFIDLPGTYSLYPKSLDEEVSYKVLCQSSNPDHPNITIVVADASNLQRSLFLLSQIVDLKMPVILALNMMDMVKKEGKEIDVERLTEKLGIKTICISARNNKGIADIKKAIAEPISVPQFDFIPLEKIAPELIQIVKTSIKTNHTFFALQYINNIELQNKNEEAFTLVYQKIKDNKPNVDKIQSDESVARYQKIKQLISECVFTSKNNQNKNFTHRLDKYLTHKIWGYVFFLMVLFFIFQSIFFLAQYPMEWIENLFSFIADKASNLLPAGELNNLFVNGILAGLSGVVVFVPQIALLFAFIALLEDSGYMARVSFIMDKLMKKFGINGRSVIPLISGVACAVPAIMSTRTISNWKERIITILVTPLMSCSARLPVYTLIISLIIPQNGRHDFISYQGLLLMLLYLIGFAAALVAAFVFKWILKSKEKSYFIMELPVYRSPQLRSVYYTIYEKVKLFLWDAGKIIVAISVILWFLTSHAPGDRFEQIEKKYEANTSHSYPERQARKASEKLENSYAGIIGKKIEPAIAPLGFDWKIGISLVTSFAAREVFVGTMATIYSNGDADNTASIREKMQNEKNPVTGKPVFSLAVGISLLLFYAFAMQCMSTLAIVYRETKSWKWPLIQFVYMSALAYFASLIAFQLLK
jgi:ferrous iron transport protein B